MTSEESILRQIQDREMPLYITPRVSGLWVIALKRLRPDIHCLSLATEQMAAIADVWKHYPATCRKHPGDLPFQLVTAWHTLQETSLEVQPHRFEAEPVLPCKASTPRARDNHSEFTSIYCCMHPVTVIIGGEQLLCKGLQEINAGNSS